MHIKKVEFLVKYWQLWFLELYHKIMYCLLIYIFTVSNAQNKYFVMYCGLDIFMPASGTLTSNQL